jgi:phospholipid/cholesterol/gamma-HCH transport system substrate-binding protein
MNRRWVVQIRRYGRSFLILLLLMVLGLGGGFYILIQQRLPNPFTHFVSVNAAFPTAAAVVPGLGEPVDVAGVHIGEILSTSLRNGEGIVHMEIDPSKGVPHLYRNASAQLIPNTPLMDMYVDIDPGTPAAGILPAGGTIPASETTSPTSADEVLDELDADTRDWLSSLITELAGATQGRGQDIRRLLLDLGPTARQLRQVGDLLARRRTELAGLVHNLGVLSHAASQDDTQLGGVVRSGEVTVQALASQNGALRQSIGRLPATLATTRSTLSDLTGFSEQLGPTATALIPTARDLPATLRDTRTLIRGAALLPLNRIKQFEAVVNPLTRVLPTVRRELTTTIPELEDTFKVLTYVVNETAYTSRSNPGFLYWLAWFAHNTDSFVGNADANGTAWRTLALSSCTSLETFSFGPLLQALLGTTFGCPKTGGAG